MIQSGFDEMFIMQTFSHSFGYVSFVCMPNVSYFGLICGNSHYAKSQRLRLYLWHLSLFELCVNQSGSVTIIPSPF